MEKTKIAVVTVTYGERWKFLSQMADAVIEDPNLYKLVIVNNASQNYTEIEKFANLHKDKIHLIDNETNTGSAGGFARGLQYARGLDCDYVLLLDDDNVPEENFGKLFLDDVKKVHNEKAVILGNRNNLKGNEEAFYKNEKIGEKVPDTFFEVFSFKKFKYFSSIIFSNKKSAQENFKPIVEVEAFAYSGTFMPVQAIQDSPLPDPQLFTYADDVEYSWGVRKAGYKIYLCDQPIIKDIDLTFQESHILDMFSKNTLDFKIFFRIRNMVIISKRHAQKSKIILFLNVAAWFLALCLYAFFKLGINKFMIQRAALIFKALLRGLKSDFNIPPYIHVPGNARVGL